MSFGDGWVRLDYPLGRSKFGPVYVILMVIAIVSVIGIFLYLPKEMKTDYNKFPAEHVYKQGVPIDLMMEALLERDFNKVIAEYGEWGSPSYLEKVKDGNLGVRKMRMQYAMNVNVSDRIPLNRSLPETRPRECKKVIYDDNLPKASIIVVSRNEAWTVLLRTLHSIVDRTHKEFVKEIIVVDDKSVYPGMKHSFQDKLDYYIKRRLPDMVSFIRLPKRLGVVNARLVGARAATGDVLIFLDAHCEVNEGWIRPLLHRIKESPETVLQPVIDPIDWDTFEYAPFNVMHQFPMGTFTWAGMFEWLEMDIELIRNRSGDASANAESAVMAGGIFAIDRKFFWKIGSYDEKMSGWGAENIEMSIRIWTCGGRMEIVPCSRVGHVFRPRTPQDPEDEDASLIIRNHKVNILRTVKVWWDEYERIFFQYRPSMLNVTAEEYGELSERVALRKQLQCKPFDWYLKNVYNNYVMDESPLHGRVMSDVGLCLWFDGQREGIDHNLDLHPCFPHLAGKLYFALSSENHLRRELLCAIPHPDWRSNITRVRMTLCSYVGRATWAYHPENKTIVFTRYNECLDSNHGAYATLQKCHPLKASQKWNFLDSPYYNATDSVGPSNHKFVAPSAPNPANALAPVKTPELGN